MHFDFAANYLIKKCVQKIDNKNKISENSQKIMLHHITHAMLGEYQNNLSAAWETFLCRLNEKLMEEVVAQWITGHSESQPLLQNQTMEIP